MAERCLTPVHSQLVMKSMFFQGYRSSNSRRGLGSERSRHGRVAGRHVHLVSAGILMFTAWIAAGVFALPRTTATAAESPSEGECGRPAQLSAAALGARELSTLRYDLD